LTSYGEVIGLGFQIADDLLDVYGDAETMGKNTGKDYARSKCTFPGIFGVEAAEQRLEDLTVKAVEIMEPFQEEGEFFTQIATQLSKRDK
jgi:geranylgeranyl pyrophosphate synthase